MSKRIVCGIQIQSYPCEIERNTNKIVDWIEKVCKKIHPVLISFPEAVTTGFTPKKPIHKFNIFLKSKLPGVFKAIGLAAKKNKVAIILPTYEPCGDNYLFNNAVVFNSDGKIIGRYSKCFPFLSERWTKAGDGIRLFSVLDLKFSIVICYDGDFPLLSQEAALRDAELIIRPSAFLRNYEIWFLTNRVRAYENQVYFMAVNSCGTDMSGKLYFGHSMIVNPYAKIVSEIGTNEGFIYANIIPKERIIDPNIVRVDHIKDIKAYLSKKNRK